MISKIVGKLVEKRENSVIIDVGGLQYEIGVPASILHRIDDTKDKDGNVQLVTYHYIQLGQGTALPFLIGFLSGVERDFFLQIITVSGIGPKAAIRALNKPISEISRAIHDGDLKYLTSLPGIGTQRAKEIVAKLQGKVAKFGLIQDKNISTALKDITADWQEEALQVLLQLQYKRHEALDMIHKALERSKDIQTAESLLNEIYKQKVKS